MDKILYEDGMIAILRRKEEKPEDNHFLIKVKRNERLNFLISSTEEGLLLSCANGSFFRIMNEGSILFSK